MAAFNANPQALYTIPELFSGFNPADPVSFEQAPDFQIYLEFVRDGGSASTNKPKVLERAAHDCTILQLLADELSRGKVVAIMGGHAVERGSQAYDDTAKTAALLTERGYLVITGGGPGAMEAAHLGAAVGKADDDLKAALKEMSNGPKDSKEKPVIYDPAQPNSIKVDRDAVRRLGEYYKVGWEVRQNFPDGGGVAIPTWMYGWEPTTVFATKVGKYFQNSIREDGLLAAATDGIVFCQGSAGTMQEIFQDAAQNYYKSFPGPAEAGRGRFSPMVFLGDYWTVDDQNETGRKTLPVKRLLDKLWRGSAEASQLVSYVTTPEKAVEAIDAQPGLEVAPGIAIAKLTAAS